MRSHRRRTALQHVLIAGSTAEIPCMNSLLSMLPAGTYGQVLIAADQQQDLTELRTPARVTVQRVRPTSLAEAVAAWIAEWIPELTDPDRAVGIWTGSSISADVDADVQDLGELLPDIAS